MGEIKMEKTSPSAPQQETIQQKIDRQIDAYAAQAEELTEKYKEEIDYHTITERGKDKKATGRVFCCFLKKHPHILSTVKAMDAMIQGNYYSAGLMLWDVVVIEESSREVHEDKYKVGLCSVITMNLEVQAPDVKKS